MKRYEHLRHKARQLRREKEMTIDDIADRLHISRSTVYYWVKDIPLPRTEKQSDAQRRASQANRDKYRKLREAAYQEGMRCAQERFEEPNFRDFVVLYLAEGYRRTRHVVSLSNSNPQIVKLAHYWITQLSTNPKLIYELQYHVDQDVDALKAFWAEQLDISVESIRIQRKSNSGKLAGRQWRSRWGVFKVAVGDTYLRARLQAWMDYVQAQWANVIDGA